MGPDVLRTSTAAAVALGALGARTAGGGEHAATDPARCGRTRGSRRGARPGRVLDRRRRPAAACRSRARSPGTPDAAAGWPTAPTPPSTGCCTCPPGDGKSAARRRRGARRLLAVGLRARARHPARGRPHQPRDRGLEHRVPQSRSAGGGLARRRSPTSPPPSTCSPRRSRRPRRGAWTSTGSCCSGTPRAGTWPRGPRAATGCATARWPPRPASGRSARSPRPGCSTSSPAPSRASAAARWSTCSAARPRRWPTATRSPRPRPSCRPPAPVVCVHGDADTVVPLDQSQRYVAAAAAARGDARLRVVPGADHFAVIDPAQPAWTAVRAEVDEPAVSGGPEPGARAVR